MRNRTRILRRSRGFTLIEAIIALAILVSLMLVFYRVLAANSYRANFVQPKADISQTAIRNLTTQLQSAAAYDPANVFNQLNSGKKFVIKGGGAGQLNRDVTFTLKDTKNVVYDNSSTPVPVSYDVDLTFKTSFDDLNSAGNTVISIHRMTTTTDGCDPASGVTTNCNNYVVPSQ